jgi:hypothetical protein
MEMTPTQTAWAAGLFEGEGCFHARNVKPNYRAMLEMSISMTDLDVLERFQQITGIGTITTRPMRKIHSHWKDQYTWRCSGAPALKLAATIEPHLCHRRHTRLLEIRALIAASQPQSRPCECCNTTFEPTRFARERFCSDRCRDRAKYLNRKYGVTSEAAFALIPGTSPHAIR